MTKLRILESLLLLGLSCAAQAQVRPQPGAGDSRFQYVEYVADQVVVIESTPGYQVIIELAPDEQVQSVALGDSAGWQITANRNGNRLFLKPNQSNADTNMTIVTNVRTYAFDLLSSATLSLSMPYTVQFQYPRSEGDRALIIARANDAPGRYRVSGDRALRPTYIAHDDEKTFIYWADDIPLPAVFSVEPSGGEALTNGNMRDGVFVIDRVVSKLAFRIDKDIAWAEQIAAPESDE